MWSLLIVPMPPILTDDSGFEHGCEDLALEEFIGEFCVEGFAVAILPGSSGRDEERLHPQLLKEVTDLLGDELGAVVGADEGWCSPLFDDVVEGDDDIGSFDGCLDLDGEAFSAELIDDGQQLERRAFLGALMDEVVCPDVVGVLGPLLVAGVFAVADVAPSSWFLGHLESGLAPEPVDALDVDVPAIGLEHGVDAPVAEARMLLGQLVDSSDQRLVLVRQTGLVSLRGAILANQLARPALGNLEGGLQVLYCSPFPRRAQKFPLRSSFNIALSSIWSASSRFSRSFSCSRLFKRTAS